jgi:hypothetical protein
MLPKNQKKFEMQDLSDLKFLLASFISPIHLSRFAPPTRLMGMSRNARLWLTGIVLVHLIISIVHGTAHTEAHVPLSPAANVFVLTVIVAGPLVGLALMWPSQRIGAWLIASTLAGSLVFGFVNHFVFASPDHITHVDPQFRLLFTTTAVLLVVTEALGSGLAVRSLRARRSL